MHGAENYIAVANADGTGRVDLLHDRGVQNVAMSGDGSHVVFDHGNGSKYTILVANGDGTNAHLVNADGTQPTFSPDGTQIAFARDKAGIWTMALDGSNVRQLTLGDDSFPQWGAGTSAPNIPPHALGTAKNSASLAVFANAAASFDEDGTITAYEWRWGDNTAMTPKQYAWHRYAQAGTYRVRLTVVDDDGARTTRTAWVQVA
jgi:PKD repeat protein